MPISDKEKLKRALLKEAIESENSRSDTVETKFDPSGTPPDYQAMFTPSQQEQDQAIETAANTAEMQTMGGLMKMISLPTFELGDEAVATIVAPFLAMSEGVPVGEARNKALDLTRASMQSYEENFPKASTGLAAAGAIPMGFTKTSQTIGKKALEYGLKGKAAISAGTLGAIGFAEGFGAGEDGLGNRVESGIKSTPLPAVLGATLPVGGAILKPIAALGARKGAQVVEVILDKVMGRKDIPIVDSNGQITKEAEILLSQLQEQAGDPVQANLKIQEILSQEGVLTPEELKRFKLFQEYDLEPVSAQVTQKTSDWMDVQEAAKYTNEVSQRLADQEVKLRKLVENQAESSQPTTLEHQETNDFVYNTVMGVVNKSEDKISEAYRLAREEAAGVERSIPMGNLAKSASNIKPEENVSGGLVSAIQGKMKQLGLLDKRGKPVSFEGISEGALPKKVYRSINLEQAESLRQYLNELHETATPRGRTLIRQLKSDLDKDVEDVVGGDIFKDAREEVIKLDKVLEGQKRSKHDMAGKSFIEKVMTGKVKQGNILNSLTTLDKVDFKNAKKFFTEDAGEEGIESWNNVKAQVVRDALEKALGTTGKAEGGVKVFNARIFSEQFKKLKRKGLFNEIFDDPKDIKFINDIIEIGDHRLPVSRVQQGKGPSSPAIMESMIAMLDPTGVAWARLIGKQVGRMKETSAQTAQRERVLNPLEQTQQALKKGAYELSGGNQNRLLDLKKKFGFE